MPVTSAPITTIAAGSGAFVALAAGSSLSLTGYGTAQVVPGAPTYIDRGLRTLTPTEQRIGPFDAAITVDVRATSNGSGVRYYTLAPSDALVPAANNDDAGSVLSSTQVTATQALISGTPITLPNGTVVNLGAPPMLSSSCVPFAIPSSGSIGNNGALSGITTFTATYATVGMYLYFPAAAIAAGSAAGWYYTVMSSGSTGTIYNNVYTSGTPRVPSVLVPFVTTGPGAYTQTTAAVDGVAITVAGGTLGASGVLYTDGVLEANNNANGKPFNVLFGGQAAGFKQMSSTNTGTFSSKVSNINASSQMLLASGSSLSGQYFGGGVSSGIVTRSSVNTANDQTLLLRLKLDTATDWLMLSGYSVLTYYAA